MERHTLQEHGVINVKRYVEEDKCTQLESGQRMVKRRGQTMCIHCGACYNNRIRPAKCICGHKLELKEKPSFLNVVKLRSDLFSVRKHSRGICKRVIVNLSKHICYAHDCMEARAHCEDRSKFICDHLKACMSGSGVSGAVELKIHVKKIKKFIKCSATLLELIKAADAKSFLTVYKLPDNYLVIPVMRSASHECFSGMIHIDPKRFKCPITRCSLKPRYHYLVKTELMCIHVLLCKIALSENLLPPQLEPVATTRLKPQFSKVKTVSAILSNIYENIPSVLHIEREEIFLQQSFDVQQKLLDMPVLAQFEEKYCSKCGTPNVLRKKKGLGSYLVTPGYMVRVDFNLYMCKSCDILLYPHMYKEGFVPVSENLIVSWSYMVEARNQAKNGSKLFSFFKSSLKRLCLENKNLAPLVSKVDFHNMAVGLAKVAIAYNCVTLLQPLEDLDSLSAVLCLYCGVAPLTLMSDGNAKNSILLRGGCDNLEFNQDDEESIPSLDSFVMKCANSVAGTALFQHYPKEKINVFKIPLIMGNRITGKVNNRECMKKSVFQEDIDFSQIDFNKLEKVVTSGEFDLLKSRSLSLDQLRLLAKNLRIPKSSLQSKVMLENVILKAVDCLVSGNSSCHKYTHSLGETGGWTDDWCIHGVKYGSKKMIKQESVIDPADIYLSLLFPPLLQILDDPCTFISHMFCSESSTADMLFGANKGCFEPPHKEKKPRTDHDCPELLPLSMFPRDMSSEALSNPQSMVHPISRTIIRKVLGTKLSDGHKSRNECLYHSTGNCKQASFIKVL